MGVMDGANMKRFLALVFLAASSVFAAEAPSIESLKSELQLLRSEVEALKAQVELLKQSKPSNEPDPGVILATIASDGSGLVTKSGSKFLIAEKDRSKVKQWRGGHFLSFTHLPDLSTKDKPVYLIENRTFSDDPRLKVEVHAVFMGQQ